MKFNIIASNVAEIKESPRGIFFEEDEVRIRKRKIVGKEKPDKKEARLNMMMVLLLPLLLQ